MPPSARDIPTEERLARLRERAGRSDTAVSAPIDPDEVMWLIGEYEALQRALLMFTQTKH